MYIKSVKLLISISLLCDVAGFAHSSALQGQHATEGLKLNRLASTALPSAAPPAELKAPPAMYQGAVAAGEAKANAPPSKTFMLSILSGCQIAFGAYLALSVGGACPGLAASNPGLQKIVLGAFGLPFGLMMVLIAGGELFTGNTALLTMAMIEKKATIQQLFRNWFVSYGGNLIGSLLLAFLAFYSGTLGAGPAAVATAVAKTSMPFHVAFVRGILCNWLVCMAVYMASGASSLPGKMTAVFFPISAFIALGVDHSVANMFLIPLGMLRGAEISVGQFVFSNLIPVTLGNIVGGAVAVGCGFAACYGSLFSKKK